MRLIDADALKARLELDKQIREGSMYAGIMSYIIDSTPTIDAVPVKHGRWIGYPECLGYENAYSDEDIVCSECQHVWNIIDNDVHTFDYCPHCGAKMDGERKNT